MLETWKPVGTDAGEAKHDGCAHGLGDRHRFWSGDGSFSA